ncbi:MAG TPA: cytochrome P450 [Polyangiaceae bacterium]|jgi:cytochrome P450|nr:cytochrome P450 [Polyangiaceae bacterium]
MPLPAGPTTPAAVQVVRWIRSPFQVMAECHARFGDAFTMRLPGMGGVVVVADPLAVKEVFGMGPDEGHAGKANFLLAPVLGRHSLLLLDGAEHLRQRKMILPAFHGERMHAYGRTMLDVASASIDAWPLGEAFPVHRPMQEITLQIILRTVFGVEEGPRFVELADALKRMLDATANPILLFPFMQRDLGRLSPWGRFKVQARRASDILRSEIRRGREKGSSGRLDVLAMMLDARDEKGRPLSEDEVHDELVTLLVAGHETTATALAWTLRWVLPDRALVGRLNEELATADGDPARIGKLPLLDATVKESLRLQPVIPMVGRVLQQATTVGGLDLPAGALVAPSIYLVHRRPSLYPEPERFRPERFLDFKPAAWEWLPFGGGLRRCVGAAFAMYEMKMVLAATLPRVEMRLALDRVRGVRRTVTVTPEQGLPVVVTTKRSRASLRTAA